MKEAYKPTATEIKNAEEMMNPELKKLSIEREKNKQTVEFFEKIFNNHEGSDISAENIKTAVESTLIHYLGKNNPHFKEGFNIIESKLNVYNDGSWKNLLVSFDNGYFFSIDDCSGEIFCSLWIEGVDKKGEHAEHGAFNNLPINTLINY